MPTYILLSTLTPEGCQTLNHALLGLYDFISIIEAADNETVAHLTHGLGSARHGEYYGVTGGFLP